MKVLIVTEVFPPEGHPSAIMGKELAQEMGRQGWEVTVVAGYPHHPYGKLFPGWHKKWIVSESQSGFRLVRGWHLISPSPSVFMRSLVMASQGIGRLISSLSCRSPDVVISFGIPLMGPLISAMIAKKTRAHLVTVIYDLYPDVAIEMEKLTNPLIILALKKIERLVYRWSDRVVVLSEGFRRTLVNGKGVEQGKVKVIPVWIDGAEIKPMRPDNAWRQEIGVGPEKFVVLYAGTIGLVSGAEVILKAAALLQSYEDILFLFVGAGHAKDVVEFQAREAGLENIKFLPFQPRERLSEVQAVADVSLVTLAPGRGKTSVPSKVLGYMAAARPVVAAVDRDCDTAELIQRAGCGLVIPPAQGEALAGSIIHFYENPKYRLTAGNNGLKYFRENFERSQVTKKYVQLISELSQTSS